MTQEKQKVIRVLKPSQKKKNLSPIYYGIAGVTFGIAVTSVLIFSVLGDESNNNQIVAQNNNTTVNEQPSSHDQTNIVSSKSRPTVAVANDQKEELDHNSMDDYDQPQTKLKDIPNAFKQEKQITADQTNRNPFANATSQKEAAKPVLSSEKTVVKKPIVVATTVKAKPVSDKVTPQKVEPKIQAKSEALPAKAKAVQNENDVDLPKATVQISVTRSVKE